MYLVGRSCRITTNRGVHRLSDSNIVALDTPDRNDPLQEVLREGARRLLKQAVEAELAELLQAHRSLTTDDGKPAVVRNGYLPARTIQTGLGDVDVQIPKVRDRSGSKIKFNSKLVPPYLKRTKSLEEFLPWLYLRGISSGDFSEALQHLLGPQAPGLSAGTISRLKQGWEADYKDWQQRDLSKKRFVYIWADGVYSQVRMDDRLCLLVIIGSDECGRKELLALSDGYRESAASWGDVLRDLERRGLKTAPKLAVGDGALGFWKALAKVWPETNQQRCWVHKTANVLEKLPKAMQPKVKQALHEVWQAETREAAYKAFDTCIERFEAIVPQGHDLPGQRQERDAGVLRLSGRALAAHSHDESNRVGVCHRAITDHQNQELWQSRHDARHGLQADANGAEAMASIEGLQVIGRRHYRREVREWR